MSKSRVKKRNIPKGYVDDLLGKIIGHWMPFKKARPKFTKSRVWCKNLSFPGAPDKLIYASDLRHNKNVGKYMSPGEIGDLLGKTFGYLTPY